MVTHFPPHLRSKAGPFVGKLVQLLTHSQQFIVQNLEQIYVLVSSAYKTYHCAMTCTVLKAR